jgi:hypothetical protein
MERYPRGRRGRFAKALGCNSREGSNPSLSATMVQTRSRKGFFLLFYTYCIIAEMDKARITVRDRGYSLLFFIHYEGIQCEQMMVILFRQLFSAFNECNGGFHNIGLK